MRLPPPPRRRAAVEDRLARDTHRRQRVRKTSHESRVTPLSSCLLPHPPKRLVMIAGVIEFPALARHDTPRTAAFHAGRGHGVLAIVAAFPGRQQLFEIPEDDAVALVRVRPPFAHERDRLPRL